jgi:hypothetical protein
MDGIQASVGERSTLTELLHFVLKEKSRTSANAAAFVRALPGVRSRRGTRWDAEARSAQIPQ